MSRRCKARVERVLLRWYWFSRRAIAPTLRYSQYLYEDTLRCYLPRETMWLDLGCGRRVLPEWRSQQEKALVTRSQTLVGLDYDLDSLRANRSVHLRVRGSAEQLPFTSNTFDLVTANMVVEHAEDPRSLLRDVQRVLRPGGTFIFHTPNAFGYVVMLARAIPEWAKPRLIYVLQGRREEDVFQTHYRMNTAGVIGELAEASRFEVVEIRLLVSDAALAVIPPLATLELLWIRALMTAPLKPLRTNIIAILRKPAA